MYIAFEGVDTCGKTTQIEMLKKPFPHFIYTKEPGGTDLGARVRELALHHRNIDEKSRLFLFLADRSEHIAKVIKPNIDKTIVSDRSIISGLAYSKFGVSDFEQVKTMSLFAVNGIVPSLVIILRLDEATIRQRLGSKTADEIEKQGIEKLLQIQERMPRICDELGIKYEIMDASQTIEEIHNKIKAIVQ